MDGIVDFLRQHRDRVWRLAVAAALLAILYPLVQAYYIWIGGDHILSDHPEISFWVLGVISSIH